MKRTLAICLTVSALGWLTPSLFGQYPYGYAPPMYGPMPAQYAPPYGAPPMYGPPMPYPSMPMMPPPGPMWQAPPANRPTVMVYGPLTPALPDAPPAKPAPMPYRGFPEPANGGNSAIQPTQSSLAPTLPPESPAIQKVQMAPETSASCAGGGSCFPDCFSPLCETSCPASPMRGHGHFFLDAGANFLVPLFSTRQAFSSTTNGNTTSTNFPEAVDIGPHVSAGYLFHNAWGFRFNYSYLRGSVGQSATNADPLTTIALPVGPITSPSAALARGIGIDQFLFKQRLDMHAVDIDILRECHVLDTTVLFGAGVRYATSAQSYGATRTNPGGTNNAGVTVGFDREDLDTGSQFNGWGPTFSAEFVHPLRCNFSLYGSFRGSFLWGVDQFYQNYRNQNNTVDVRAGVATFTDITTASVNRDSRLVTIGETELGVQFGQRCGRCYVYMRVGAVFDRWWNVGSPTSADGNLSLLGGAARLGISY